MLSGGPSASSDRACTTTRTADPGDAWRGRRRRSRASFSTTPVDPPRTAAGRSADGHDRAQGPHDPRQHRSVQRSAGISVVNNDHGHPRRRRRHGQLPGWAARRIGARGHRAGGHRAREHFACNYAPGLCSTEMEGCRVDVECALQLLRYRKRTRRREGRAGLRLGRAAIRAVLPPTSTSVSAVSTRATTPYAECEPHASAPTGINVSSPSRPPPSRWPATSGSTATRRRSIRSIQTSATCAVASLDVRVAPGTTPLDLGTPTGPRHGPNPVVQRFATAPRAPVSSCASTGGAFNAIDGAACHRRGCRSIHATPEIPRSSDGTRATSEQGNHVTVTMDGVAYRGRPSVTPTMLVFAMRSNAAAAILTVASGNDVRCR